MMACSRLAGLRPTTVTVAPAFARRAATARPMPRPPPVTSACRPLRDVMVMSFRRERLLTGLHLQLGPGLRLSLHLEVFEILPVADGVAEDLVLAGKILRRAVNILRAIPGRSLHGEERVDQMRPPERHEIGASRGKNRVHLIGRGDVADAHGGNPRFIAHL